MISPEDKLRCDGSVLAPRGGAAAIITAYDPGIPFFGRCHKPLSGSGDMSQQKNIRERAWEIVEAARPGDNASRAFDIAILALIFLNVLAVIIGSVESIQERWGKFLKVFEIISVAVFTV